jgi:hypothetical protein
MIQSGKTLSMHSEAVFKGTYTNNGTLLKLHENAYTVGYSAIKNAAGTAAGTVKFGNGVFFDLSKKNNNIYAGAPTGTGAVPAFGGILTREPAIASGYPTLNDEMNAFQHGILCREGYIVYKKGTVEMGSSVKYEDVELFDYVFQNYCLWVRASNGEAYFSPKNTVYAASGDIYVGRVVEINPDDRSVTVYISPVLLANTTDIAGMTPTITVDNAGITNTAIPFAVTLGTEGAIKLSYKLHSAADYTAIDGIFNPVWDEANSNWKLEYTLEGLTKNTAYDIKADAITAGGVNSDTETNVSTTNV